MEKNREIEALKEQVASLEKELALYKSKLHEQVLIDAVKSADRIYPWHYHIINELTGMGIWQLDLVTEKIVWSEKNFHLFGVEPGTIEPAEAWSRYVYPEDQKNVDEAFKEAMDGNAFYAEMKVLWPDDSTHYIGGAGIVIRDNGEPINVVGVNWDMTQQWEKTETIKFYDDLVNGAMESSHIGVFWSMSDRIFSEFEGLPVVGSLMDIQRNDNLKFHVRDLFVRLWHTAREYPQYKKMIQSAIKSYALLNKGIIDHLNLTYPICHGNGNLVWVNVKMYLESVNSGLDKRIIGTLIEVTDSKNLEMLNARNEEELEVTIVALEKAKQRADSASEAKSLFLANMSHEIRTPLNAIIGLGYLLKATFLDAQQLDYIRSIEDASHNLSSIVSDILDFSKIEAGELALDVVDFELAKVIEHVRMLMMMKKENKNSEIELVFNIDEDIPAMVLGDPVRLGQVLINLGTNAIKFTDQGYVAVKVRLLEQDDSRIKLGFVVEDSGIGIDEKDIRRIFSTFQQADSSTTRKYGGTGLGLAISKRLVELMGGTINVASTIGHGSRFSFVINLQPSTGENQSIKFGTGANRLMTLSNRKVLLVEDNLLNQKVVIELLKKVKIKVVVARNGMEAMEIINTGKCIFDLILMDLQMPKMDGYATTSMIRVKESYQAIPIIVMTADISHGVKNRILQIGADDYISKPVDAYHFYRIIEKWLGFSQS